jgi:hypothetical protein
MINRRKKTVPTQAGDCFGFGLGGGWWRLRFDLLLGMYRKMLPKAADNLV